MKLLFTRTCICTGPTALPKPAFHLTSVPDMSSPTPECKLTIDLKCPLCGAPWESSAALLYAPKAPKPRIII